MADRSDPPDASVSANAPLVDLTDPIGSDEHADAVWRVKERIHRVEGLLDQHRAFFDAQYRQSTCYLAVATVDRVSRLGRESGESDALSGPDMAAGDVVGFAIVTRDGYLSLLGVAPAHRRRGLGSGLVERAVEDHPRLSCHVRVTNAGAIGFYADRGFLVERRVDGYYRDGTAAYRLVRDPERAASLADVLD